MRQPGRERCWNCTSISPPGYKTLSCPFSKFPRWSVSGLRSDTTMCLRRVWAKASRPLGWRALAIWTTSWVWKGRFKINEKEKPVVLARGTQTPLHSSPPSAPRPAPRGRGGRLLALDLVFGYFSKYPVRLQMSTSLFHISERQDLCSPGSQLVPQRRGHPACGRCLQWDLELLWVLSVLSLHWGDSQKTPPPQLWRPPSLPGPRGHRGLLESGVWGSSSPSRCCRAGSLVAALSISVSSEEAGPTASVPIVLLGGSVEKPPLPGGRTCCAVNHDPCLCAHTVLFFVPGAVCVFLTVLPVDTAHLNCACEGLVAQSMPCSKPTTSEFTSLLTGDRERGSYRIFTELL